jgi:2-polyprenyl-3-methyl-5-hydroxy-6-metoxy-1,4-benzoquinol methylase
MNIREHNNLRYSGKLCLDKFAKLRVKKTISLIGSCETILDVGCYDGSIMEILKCKCNKIVGIDNSISAILNCTNKGLTVKLLKGEKFPFKDNSFDCIVAGEVIEHVFDTKNFLLEINRVLKKNGQLIITTPNLVSFGSRIMMLFGKKPWMMEYKADKKTSGHVRYFTSDTLSELLNECRFKPVIKTCEALTLTHGFYITNEFITEKFHKLGRILIFKCKKGS